MDDPGLVPSTTSSVNDFHTSTKKRAPAGETVYAIICPVMTFSRRRAEQRMERAITGWSTQKIYPSSLKEIINGRPRKPRRPRCSLSMSCGTDMDLLGLPMSRQAYSRIPTLKPSYSFDFSKPHLLLLSLFPAHLE